MDITQETNSKIQTQHLQFKKDVILGLLNKPKCLNSKYFYDAVGDVLFQKIMRTPAYYLTDCEMEILTEQAHDIVEVVKNYGGKFDIVGLGTGDATKAIHLLKEFNRLKMLKRYMPIDISPHIITGLSNNLPRRLPGVFIRGYAGEYMEMLEEIKMDFDQPKIVLFLGSSIGNFSQERTQRFCKELYNNLRAGDMAFIGFDLKKHPQTILNAYNDKEGFTREFNLNLLQRINKELDGDFEIDQFEHYPTYDPITGSCKSYLISLKDQVVNVADEEITFSKNEPIFMEVSQKFSVEETDKLAEESGFKIVHKFFDKKRWFMDSLWVKK